jgi:5-methylcytosine-specific restriction endonuclease McrA
VPPSILKRGGRAGTYCSKACECKKVERVCQHCQKTFEVRPSEIRFKYCSRPCYYEGRRVSREHYLERARAKTRARKARLYNAMGDFSMEYFVWLCKRIGRKCVLCNQRFALRDLTIDHIVPITRGGKHSNANIQPMCGKYNAVKGNRRVLTVPSVREAYNEWIRLPTL